MSSSTKLIGDIIFNNTVIPPTQIFLIRKNVFGIINHKPFINGHVIICSRKVVPMLENLTQIETLDLFMTAQEVSKKLSAIYNTQYDLTIQNGKQAGQTVNHVHMHLCPHGQKNAKRGLEREHQEDEEEDQGAHIQKEQQKRSEQDMAKQAEKYRGLFEQSSE